MMSIVRRVQAVLPMAGGQTDHGSRRDQRPSTRLYRCANCETTYVSEEMDACPSCGTDVEAIPTGRDLGLVGE